MNIKIVTRNELKMPECVKIPINVEDNDWLGSGRLGTFLVPDVIFGISLKKAGYIHDKCYELQIGKQLADDLFLHNMRVLICRDYNLIIRASALELAETYYYAVCKFGQKSYDKCAIK